jgi:hypothetical protein
MTSTEMGTAPTTLAVAGLASLGAGVIHATAAGLHGEHRQAAVAFALLAAFQVAWGVVALVWAPRLVIALGTLANAVALGGWLTTRTSGIGFIDGLEAAESAGFADSAAAALAVVAVLGAVAYLVAPPGSACRRWPGRSLQPRSPAPSSWWPWWRPPATTTLTAAGVNDYDSFAEAYSAEAENSLVNAYYERPGMLALAGDVAGRRILDAGCGSGPLSAACATVVRSSPASTPAPGWWRWRSGGSVTTWPCTWSICATACRSPTARSTTWSRRWCCTTWRTGGRRWPSCGECSGPAAG